MVHSGYQAQAYCSAVDDVFTATDTWMAEGNTGHVRHQEPQRFVHEFLLLTL